MLRQTGRQWSCVAGAFVALVLLCACPPAAAEDAKPGPQYAGADAPAIEEKLGETIPLDLTFRDEDGKDVTLRELIDGPTILTLVYFRCPKICNAVMNELAHTVDEVEKVKPGKGYRILTVSFDYREGPEIATLGKKNLLARLKTEVPPESWRFLTGNQENIARLTDAVGFRFKQDPQGDFDHAGTVIFLTKTGLIVRYLGGLALLPFDVEMAVNDAAEGTPRTVMQRVQQLCYAYDPESKRYTLQVTRIVLWVTLLGLGILGGYLLLKRNRAPASRTPLSTDPTNGGAA
jgi:protein SCO1/2